MHIPVLFKLFHLWNTSPEWNISEYPTCFQVGKRHKKKSTLKALFYLWANKITLDNRRPFFLDKHLSERLKWYEVMHLFFPHSIPCQNVIYVLVLKYYLIFKVKYYYRSWYKNFFSSSEPLQVWDTEPVPVFEDEFGPSYFWSLQT